MTEERSIPEPIMLVLRERFPRLLQGEIEGEDVYLLMSDSKGQPHHAVRYIASPEFLTAVRVADSGLANLEMLASGDFTMTLLAPNQG